MTSTALLVMDVQTGIVERYPEHGDAVLGAVTTATTAARPAGVHVIYVRIAFRPGAPEVSPRNRAFASRVGSASFGLDDPATRIHPAVAPRPGDVEVVKKRVSAFAGSDLDVSALVLAGIATGGVVLSTVRQAADLDYELTVLRDACADADPEVHRVLLDKVFPLQAAVLDTDQWAGVLSPAQ